MSACTSCGRRFWLAPATRSRPGTITTVGVGGLLALLDGDPETAERELRAAGWLCRLDSLRVGALSREGSCGRV